MRGVVKQVEFVVFLNFIRVKEAFHVDREVDWAGICVVNVNLFDLSSKLGDCFQDVMNSCNA